MSYMVVSAMQPLAIKAGHSQAIFKQQAHPPIVVVVVDR